MSIALELENNRLKLALAEIKAVDVTDDELIVDLMDGRTIAAPILWFPRLAHGTPDERRHFEVMRDGVHWPDLDEDIGLSTLPLGRGMGERPESLQRWLDQRGQTKVAANGASQR